MLFSFIHIVSIYISYNFLSYWLTFRAIALQVLVQVQVLDLICSTSL